MNSSSSIAANLSNDARKRIAFLSLVKSKPITELAKQEGVSRQYIYRQKNTVMNALDQAFAANDAGVLFNLPVTQAWLDQLMVSLTLTCRSSYHGVKELLRDLFDVSVSVGTIHNRVHYCAEQAGAINRAEDLSTIRVGLHDELFQNDKPVLAGVDAASTYCYLLVDALHRDADTWAIHLFDLCAQGFHPDHIIADAGAGLRAGQKIAMGDTRCLGNIFHIVQQCESLANVLARLAKGAVSRCRTLELKMEAKKNENDHTLSTELVLARQKEQQAVRLARDVKTLVQWLNHDVFALAGLDLAQRRILVDFIVAELRQREHLDSARIRPVRRALENQRDDVLAFAGVLDAKLADIAHGCSVPLTLVRDACLLQRKSSLSSAYWQRWNQSITSSPTNSMVSSMPSSRR